MRSESARILRDATKLFSAQLANGAIALVFSAWLVRTISREELALYPILGLCVGFVASVSGLGLSMAQQRLIPERMAAGNEAEARAIARTCLRISVAGATVLAALAAVFAPQLSRWLLKTPGFTTTMRALAPAILLGAVANHFSYLLQSTNRFGQLSLNNMVTGSLGVMLAVPGYLLAGRTGLVCAMTVPSALAVILAFVPLRCFLMGGTASAVGGLGERYRRWFRAGTALSLIGVGLSFERGAWLAAGVALGVLFLYRPLRRPAGIVIAASVVLAGAGLLFSSHSWLENRVVERSNVQDRVRFLAARVGIVQSPEWNWATGIGEGGYLEIAYRYMPPRSYYDVDRKTEADKNRAQHNDYLCTVIEHGVPGGLLLLLMVGLLIGRGVKLARDERRGVTNLDGRLGIALLAAASTVLVDAATHNTLVESQIMTGLWLVCALLYSDQAMTKDTLSLLALRQESHVPGAGSR